MSLNLKKAKKHNGHKILYTITANDDAQSVHHFQNEKKQSTRHCDNRNFTINKCSNFVNNENGDLAITEQTFCRRRLDHLNSTWKSYKRSSSITSRLADSCYQCDTKYYRNPKYSMPMNTLLASDCVPNVCSNGSYFRKCYTYFKKYKCTLLLHVILYLACFQIVIHEVGALFVNEAISDGIPVNTKNNMGFMGNATESKIWETFSIPIGRDLPTAAALELKRASKTTKRSISDIFAPHLTTVATPLLTTMRYLEKSHHQKQINLHHRNYELDLERDHALPTSAPNADILKSNSNPTYPNPNRHHSHDRDRHRHILNSTPQPSLPNILKKSNNQTPTIPMYPGEVPSYSPPARSFFTPPLPPEYQHPFADKPTLRGTNNDGSIANSATYINRRPIPPPSLMPGHERIPFRPPDIPGANGGEVTPVISDEVNSNPQSSATNELDRKKVLNTPSHSNSTNNYSISKDNTSANMDNGADESYLLSAGKNNPNQEVLPSIRRILSGSNGKNGDIPEVLLKQVTQRPVLNYHQPPSSPVVILDSANRQPNDANEEQFNTLSATNNKINSDFNTNASGVVDMSSVDPRTDQTRTKISNTNGLSSTPTDFVANNDVLSDSSTYTTTIDGTAKTISSNSAGITPSSSTIAAAAAAQATWTIAWNTHVYLSVVLFTILAVYSFYKMFTFNKLTHLFSQSYFICIHLILIIICCARIFYLCFDAYNVHGSFHMFVSEILLNLPATFLSTAFAVLILYLFLKSLNHKNNRYSALIRPLTVVVGCGVHVVLCITLHYVESYTMHNHNQQLYYQQHQQQLYRKHYNAYHHHESSSSNGIAMGGTNAFPNNSPATNYSAAPLRILSLICQIIYIFVCLSLGMLYLYLYRILKRILRSKSQNYIHGYQNLSYAIHITIATALLFVLLAALQIFGVISISTNRPIVTQANSEIDWLQWGYQFSLRLIEIAIVTLISWVTSLKTSTSNSNGTGHPNSNVPMSSVGASSGFGTSGGGNREKHGYTHNHSNMAGFFLPCTSSSSQEQFETDYPAVCNANTNLHTYTMRTGKLIYDDSFVLNSLGSGGQTAGIGRMVDDGMRNDFQIPQPTYQHPYDTGSLHSSKNQNIGDYGTVPGSHRYHHHRHHSPHDNHHYSDYLTDGTTDHYENPNFDLRGPVSSSDVPNSNSQKFVKTSTTSTNASSIGGSGSTTVSQQQMLLLQNDNCYSEPLQEGEHVAANLNFNNFERPNFASGTSSNNFISKSSPLGYWSDQPNPQLPPYNNKQDRKNQSVLSRGTFDNPDRRSGNSNHSFTSNGGIARYGANGYNSFDRSHYNKGIRKSGTLSNFGLSVLNDPNAVTDGTANGTTTHGQTGQRAVGIQTLTVADRYQHNQSGIRAAPRTINDHVNIAKDHESDAMFSRGAYDRTSDCAVHQHQHQKQYQRHHNSDDDDILSGSNVECTNLINNEDGSCITNSSSTNSACGNLTDLGICSNSTNSERLLKQTPTSRQHLLASNKLIHSHNNHNNTAIPHNLINQNHSSGHDTASASSTSNSGAGTPSDSVESAGNEPSSNGSAGGGGSMLVAEHGFVRFRAIDDMNNAQGIGIHNASIRNKNRNSSATTTLTSA